MKSIRVAFALAAALMLAAPASAQVQNKAQQACLNKVVKAGRKVPGTVLKDAVGCIRKGAVGKLPMGVTATQCLGADLKGKVAKALSKLDSAAVKSCTTAPDFGWIDSNTSGIAYESENQALSDDAFGSDLDATLLGSDAVDAAGRCSATLPGAWRKVEDAMHRTVEACLKSGLKAGTVLDNATYEACLDSITADSKGRVAKAVAQVQKLLTIKCPSGNLDTLFPGLTPICAAYGDSTDAAGLASCSRDRMACRVCRIFDFAYGLDRDCDLFDDTLANGTCPDCGNTVIDSGEDCDDGNEISGDGCTALCTDEFCGDAVINDNGAEACDNGNANSNTTPNACRLSCVNPTCGDSVTDAGEECDDGNLDDSDGCTTQCTSCGNGSVSGAEQCDDGNNLDGDCCSASCTFESGVCESADECVSTAHCQLGACTVTSYVVTGAACRWAVVGNPGIDNDKRMEITDNASGSGNWCANFGRFGNSVVMNGDLVTSGGDNATPGAEFRNLANINASNVITDNARVSTYLGDLSLPGLVATQTIAPGLVVNKTPSPTYYNTTGVDPRVQECKDAQLSISTSTATLLDALPSNQNLGGAWTGIGTGETRTASAGTVGGLNVIDLTNITGGNNNITLNFDGGGSAATVMIIRVSDTINTGIGWTWNLTGGLLPENLMFYGKGSGGNNKCAVGQQNNGKGTIFCPSGRIRLIQSTVWQGALYGGGDTVLAIDVGDGVQFTHKGFTGF